MARIHTMPRRYHTKEADFIKNELTGKVLTASVPRSDLHFRRLILKSFVKMDVLKGAILEKEVQDRGHPKDPNNRGHLLDIYYVSKFWIERNGYVVCEYKLLYIFASDKKSQLF